MTEQRPMMCLFNTVTGEMLPVQDLRSLLCSSVTKLQTMVSVQTGIPVSKFWLCTPAGVQLYQCNWLDYGTETAHQDTRKCLIQAAAESSQTLSLELFITKSILSLASRDPGGCKPLKIAVQHEGLCGLRS
ncbi:LOW QUALITY PROTEIN: protein ANKUB1-like [Pelmatolapia mariae]|uniref:LOW QUALITY PROTEIN: protein ANKUB1-like n=1 Tax=Pelmatolapia mariae TaxID=158779 RepID=UPI002FE53C77